MRYQGRHCPVVATARLGYQTPERTGLTKRKSELVSGLTSSPDTKTSSDWSRWAGTTGSGSREVSLSLRIFL